MDDLSMDTGTTPESASEHVSTASLQKQVDQINRKLDIILQEIELQRRHRQEMEDLKADLMRVGKDLYRTAVVELDEMHDHVDTGDVVHLFKRILRNLNNIDTTLQRLESMQDFLRDFEPISRELFLDTMRRLDEMDRKGYFEFLDELVSVGDRVVTSYGPEDVRKLGDNIVTILDTVKNLSQEDVLSTVNNALSVYRQMSVDVPDSISTWQLIRELNTPETRRGIAFLLRFQRSLLTLEVTDEDAPQLQAENQPAEATPDQINTERS